MFPAISVVLWKDEGNDVYFSPETRAEQGAFLEQTPRHGTSNHLLQVPLAETEQLLYDKVCDLVGYRLLVGSWDLVLQEVQEICGIADRDSDCGAPILG